MKTNISIMTWINRLLIVPFILCLLAGIIDFSFLYYSAYIAFVVGCYQVFSFLFTSIYFRKINQQKRKYLIIYILLVISYFLIWFIIDHFNFINSISFIIYPLYLQPIILSLFWTYILETLNKEL